MEVGLPLLAATISTVIFAGSMLPMVVKSGSDQGPELVQPGQHRAQQPGQPHPLGLRLSSAGRARLGAAHVLPGHDGADAGLVPALPASPPARLHELAQIRRGRGVGSFSRSANDSRFLASTARRTEERTMIERIKTMI